MPKKKHRTQQACIHLYNLPVPPAGHPTPRPPDPRPKNAKRTQSRPTAPYFHETNPISSAPSPPHDEKIRNEPNLIPAPPPHNPNMQNEPNFRRDHRPTTQKRETNPISATPDLWRTKKSKRTQSHPPLVPHASCLVPQKTRNEPNLSYRWRLAGFPNPQQTSDRTPCNVYQLERRYWNSVNKRALSIQDTPQP